MFDRMWQFAHAAYGTTIFSQTPYATISLAQCYLVATENGPARPTLVLIDDSNALLPQAILPRPFTLVAT